jgi:hypothetical protein
MADTKISDLTAITANDVVNADLATLVNGGANKKIPVSELKTALGLPQKTLVVDLTSGGAAPVFSVLSNSFNTNASIGFVDNEDGSATITSDVAIFSTANTRVRWAANENAFPGKHIDGFVTSTTVITISTSDIFGTPDQAILANGKIRFEIIEG